MNIEAALTQYSLAVREVFQPRITISEHEKRAGWSLMEIFSNAMKYRANVFMVKKQFDEARVDLLVACRIWPGNHKACGLLEDIPRLAAAR